MPTHQNINQTLKEAVMAATHFPHDEFEAMARLKLEKHLEKPWLELLLFYGIGIPGYGLSYIKAENLINNCLDITFCEGCRLVIPLHPVMKELIEKLIRLNYEDRETCPLTEDELFEHYVPQIARLAGINKIEECSSHIKGETQKYNLLTVNAILKSRGRNMLALGIKEEDILLLSGKILESPQQYDEVKVTINHLFKTNPFFKIFDNNCNSRIKKFIKSILTLFIKN